MFNNYRFHKQRIIRNSKLYKKKYVLIKGANLSLFKFYKNKNKKY